MEAKRPHVEDSKRRHRVETADVPIAAGNVLGATCRTHFYEPWRGVVNWRAPDNNEARSGARGHTWHIHVTVQTMCTAQGTHMLTENTNMSAKSLAWSAIWRFDVFIQAKEMHEQSFQANVRGVTYLALVCPDDDC